MKQPASFNNITDKFCNKLASFENRHPDIAVVIPNKDNNETEQQKLQRFAEVRLARIEQGLSPSDYSREELDYYRMKSMQTDPRNRYQQNRRETWAHPSNLEGCDSEKEKEDDKDEDGDCIDHGCNEECIPGCPYIPEYGLETPAGVIVYKDTAEYDAILKEWMRRSTGGEGGITKKHE